MTQGLPGALPPPPGVAVPAAVPNPLDASEAWDYVVVNGKQSPGPPGYAVVSGAGIPRKLDIREGNGMTGATVAYTGDKLSEFTVTIYLIESSDWKAWFEWRAVLAAPARGTRGKALTISHPALAVLGISAVLVKNEGQPEPDGDTGLYKVAIEMVQWKKPTPVLSTPKSAAPATQGPQPRDAAEVKMAELSQQVVDLLKP